MPTESFYRLLVEGPAAALAAFRDDGSIWAHEPWSGMFGLHLEGSDGSSLVCRYNDDYKRPAPSVAAIAAAHPALRFMLEWCDEFATVGGRATYAGGEQVKSERADPLALKWVEWDEADE